MSHYLIYANKNEAGQPNGSYTMTTGVRHHPVVPLDLMNRFVDEITKAIGGDDATTLTADIVTSIKLRKAFVPTVEVTYVIPGTEFEHNLVLEGTRGLKAYKAIADKYHDYVESNRWFTSSTYRAIPLSPVQAAPRHGLMGNPL